MNTEVLINFAAVPVVEITQDLPDGTPPCAATSQQSARTLVTVGNSRTITHKRPS
jgi:hypothetical protein